jgi:hypothetical protein
MRQISRLFVPKGVRPPKLCALGSTLAAMAGVPIPDIMVQDNWSSPKIFENHYRLFSVIPKQSVCFHVGDPSVRQTLVDHFPVVERSAISEPCEECPV